MRILITGATSGIGLEAAKILLAAPGTTLIAAARNPAAVPPALRTAKLETLDLADLTSVRALAARLTAGPKLDALILNAGLQTGPAATSKQGFELTFAVNHLAHYLLLRLLLPHLAENARIIITSSGTHDPAEGTPVTPPKHADANRLAHPETDPDRPRNRIRAGQFAYSSSKLCNVMTARELALRLAQDRPDIMVAAFDPGFTPGTGLARNYGAIPSWLFRNVLPLVMRGRRTSTPANSGRLLADLVLSPSHATDRGAYHAVRGKDAPITSPSPLARDATAAARLWQDSAVLAGVPV